MLAFQAVFARDAENELLGRLRTSGLPVERGVAVGPAWLTVEHPRVAWDAFKEFARVPVEDIHPDDDGLLYETGVFNFEYPARPWFRWGVTRQFSFRDGNDDYDHMEQLHLTFLYEPRPELAQLPQIALWSFDLGLDAFFEAAERHATYEHVVNRREPPTGIQVEQWEV